MLPKGIFIYIFEPRFAFLKALISWLLLCLSLPSPKQFSFTNFGSSFPNVSCFTP